MKRHFLQALAELRPMIKTCWEVLLRAEPPASPLGNPDTLVFMMDRTLDSFFAAASSPTPRRWLARYPLLSGPLKLTCPCGRNPFLRYYVSGEQAVLAIAAKALPGSPEVPGKTRGQILSEVQLTFHYLSQHEIQLFCDLCNSNCRRARAGIVAGRRRGPPRLPRLQPPWAAARAR
jgi:hypothetical protein